MDQLTPPSSLAAIVKFRRYVHEPGEQRECGAPVESPFSVAVGWLSRSFVRFLTDSRPASQL
jgi:hypothetical protein